MAKKNEIEIIVKMRTKKGHTASVSRIIEAPDVYESDFTTKGVEKLRDQVEIEIKESIEPVLRSIYRKSAGE